MKPRPKWEAHVTRKRFVRISEGELRQKLESILEVLQIGGAPSDLADPARSLVQAATDTERLPAKRRKHV
jgi:hypothetical protein